MQIWMVKNKTNSDKKKLFFKYYMYVYITQH